MFQIGETVLYGSEGVCTIDHIEEMRIGKTRAKYYVLKPVYRNGSTIFVPMDNATLLEKMRRILSKEEIIEILSNINEVSIEWVEDANERRAVFQGILATGDRAQIVRLIRLLYLRRQELREKGKHLRNTDELLLHDAEKLLNDEFALVLDIPQQAVPEFIRSQIA